MTTIIASNTHNSCLIMNGMKKCFIEIVALLLRTSPNFLTSKIIYRKVAENKQTKNQMITLCKFMSYRVILFILCFIYMLLHSNPYQHTVKCTATLKSDKNLTCLLITSTTLSFSYTGYWCFRSVSPEYLCVP